MSNSQDIERRLDELAALPWTVRVERDPDDQCLVARVEELPGLVATGGDRKELAADLWASIRAVLRVLIENDDPINLPSFEGLIQSRRPTTIIRKPIGRGHGSAWESTATSIMAGV